MSGKQGEPAYYIEAMEVSELFHMTRRTLADNRAVYDKKKSDKIAVDNDIKNALAKEKYITATEADRFYGDWRNTF
jgi:lipocalin